MIFLPFHGIFFFKRGGPGAGVGAAGGASTNAGKDAARHCGSSFGGGVGGASFTGEDCISPISTSGSCSLTAAIFSRKELEKSACFNVSVLGPRRCVFLSERVFCIDSRKRLRVGVRGSASSDGKSRLSPEMDPLSEECSLSPGSSSLSQWFLSADSPPVC